MDLGRCRIGRVVVPVVVGLILMRFEIVVDDVIVDAMKEFDREMAIWNWEKRSGTRERFYGGKENLGYSESCRVGKKSVVRN